MHYVEWNNLWHRSINICCFHREVDDNGLATSSVHTVSTSTYGAQQGQGEQTISSAHTLICQSGGNTSAGAQTQGQGRTDSDVQ